MCNLLVLDSFGEPRELVALFKRIGVHTGGFEAMVPKFSGHLIKVKSLDHRAANILKQELLSLNSDAAVSEEACTFRPGKGDAAFFITRRAAPRLIEKLHQQPFGLKALAEELGKALTAYERSPADMPLTGGRKLSFRSRPLVMGILNVTPDSFSDGGACLDPEDAAERARRMLDEGADLLDVGGESSRPGADPVPLDEECRRVLPVIEKLRSFSAVPLSVDTSKAELARRAVDLGADLVNDISAGRFDEAMLPLCAERKLPIVLMHMQGTPRTMQKNPRYDDLLFEVADFFRERVDAALRAGLSPSMLALDPGIGFGKTSKDNLMLIKHLKAFRSLGLPLLLGASRKSFLGAILDAPGDSAPWPKRREGGLAVTALAAERGVSILRTHDVAATHRALDATQAVLSA